MKKIIALVLTLTMSFTLCACGSSSASTPEKPPEQEVSENVAPEDSEDSGKDIIDGPSMNMVMSSHLAVGSIENQALQMIVDIMNERTGGKVTGTIYEASTLGTEMEAIEQVIAGTCTAALTSYSSFDNYAPEYSTFGVPYLYTSEAEVRASFDGPIGDAIKAAYNEQGLMFDHLMFRGNRQLTSNKMITTPEEIKGLKLRLPENEVSMAVWGGLGALTYAIDSAEVFTALQLGTVDAQENPISSNYSKGLWEVQKYTILTNHVVDFLGLIWNQDWYNGLSDEYRTLFDEACTEAAVWACQQEVENEAVLRAEMEEKGMEFVEVDCSLFAEAAAPSIAKLTDGWAEGVYEQVLADIESTK